MACPITLLLSFCASQFGWEIATCGTSHEQAKPADLPVTGIATFSCHEPSHVLDVVPGDYVAAAVLTAGAALMQVWCCVAEVICKA